MARNPLKSPQTPASARVTLAIAAALCLGVVTTGLAQAATNYSKVVAFGDSLTDTGNLLQVTTILNGISPDVMPMPLPQEGDYFNGRFSNGRVAVEVLADGLSGTIGDGKSLFLENYAYGGAQTGTGGQFANTGLLAQVSTFSKRLQPGTTADANALYFVWGGANDLRSISEHPDQAETIFNSALVNLGTVVSKLYSLGARNFLLPNLPDLGLTPQARSFGPLGMAAGTAVSESFNDWLSYTYGHLALSLPGAHLITFDTMSAQRDLTNSGVLANVTDACFTGYVGDPVGTKCADASGYLYWDKVHPTTVTHEILGAQMVARVTAVPEPSTLLTMSMGVLGLMGLAAARRRQRP